MEGAAHSSYDSNLTLLPFTLKAYWKYILTQIIWQMQAEIFNTEKIWVGAKTYFWVYTYI